MNIKKKGYIDITKEAKINPKMTTTQKQMDYSNGQFQKIVHLELYHPVNRYSQIYC